MVSAGLALHVETRGACVLCTCGDVPDGAEPCHCHGAGGKQPGAMHKEDHLGNNQKTKHGRLAPNTQRSNNYRQRIIES